MIALWILLATLVIYIYGAAKGPSVWDRLLCFNLISTKLVLIIVLYASYAGPSYLIDIAIVSELLGFISVVFIAFFLRHRLRGGKK